MFHVSYTSGNESVDLEATESVCSTPSPPMPGPAGSRPKHRSGWARRKRARPGEILAAAADVFSRFGYQRTRMTDIASFAGVTKGTIYLYFTSKAELFKHCRS